MSVKYEPDYTDTLLNNIVPLLKDYLHKLERDDYDIDAIEKMKSVNKALEYIKWRCKQ